MTSQLENLERLRQSLETNIAKLRKTLQYWQTWEIEYESFKEELERQEHEPTSDQMLAIGLDLASDVVDEREVKSLLNYGRQPLRTRAQVITQLRGRIDTGQKNAATMQKQLVAAEDKLEKVVEVADVQVMETESGDHLMDIFEELDDDGNVISSRVVDASKDRQKLQDVLKSKGLVEEVVNEDKASKQDTWKPTTAKESTPQQRASDSNPGKKVAFAQDPMPVTNESRAPPPNKMHPTQRMLVVDENDNVVDSRPLELVHPRKPAEDDEIAYMREARANAQEIAPIVASFDIETDSDEDDEDVDMDDDDSYGSENEYGMSSIGAEMTDDYKAQMEELMKKHAVAMENAGPNFNPGVVRKLEHAHRDAGLVTKGQKVNGDPSNEELAAKSNGKGVRFAEELDISPAPEAGKPASTQGPPAAKEEQVANPVSEAIMERGSGTSSANIRTSSARKPSKFKTSINTAANRGIETMNEPVVKLGTGPAPPIMSDESTALPERPKKVSRFKAAKMES